MVIAAVAVGLIGWWILGGGAHAPEGDDRSETLRAVEERVIPTQEVPAGHLVLRERVDGVALADHSPVAGAEEGPLVLIWADLMDAKMPHVQNLVGEMSERFEGRLQWGFRHLPQDQACNTTIAVTRNPGACRVAYAAQCAGAGFWEFFELLAKNPDRNDELSLRVLLARVGLTEEEAARCMASDRVRSEVEKDISMAASLGLSGAGRWLVEGHPLPLGINVSGVDAAVRLALGEVEVDSAGRVPARRMAPLSTPGEVGTMEMRPVAGFFMDAVEASVVRDGSARSVAGMVPASVNWFEADKACEAAGKRLCTAGEWRLACSGDSSTDWLIQGRRWSYSDRWAATVCWDSGNSSRNSAYETGQKPHCLSPEGIYDLTGNVWEWVGGSADEAVLVGGSFLDGKRATCSAVLEGFGPRYTAPWTGFRCCSNEAVEPTGSGLSVEEKAMESFVLPQAAPKSVVHVVRSGCTACARSTSALAGLQEQGMAVPVVVVGLGLNQEETERIVEPSGLRFDGVPDPDGLWTGALTVIEVPTTLVVDGAGNEQARMEGFSQFGWADLEEALESPSER